MKEIKRSKLERKKENFSIHRWYDLMYLDNPNYYTHTPTNSTNTARLQVIINTQKSVTFLYTNSKCLKYEIKINFSYNTMVKNKILGLEWWVNAKNHFLLFWRTWIWSRRQCLQLQLLWYDTFFCFLGVNTCGIYSHRLINDNF